MYITLLRQVMVAGESVSAGSTLDLSDAVATLLIGMGKAVEVGPPAPSAPPAKPAEDTTPKAPRAKTAKPSTPSED
jgi:hypothetical protein